MALNLIRLPYIAERVSKKDGYVVMFPDGTGKVYHLMSVPTQLQQAATRDKYIKARKIEPCGILAVDPDGLLTLVDVSNPSVQGKICALLEDRFGITYLLSHGYITKEIALSMVATGFVSAEGMEASDAVRVSEKLFGIVQQGQREEFRNWLGVSDSQVRKLTGSPDEYSPAIPTPGSNENDAISTIDVSSKPVEEKPNAVSNGNGRAR